MTPIGGKGLADRIPFPANVQPRGIILKQRAHTEVIRHMAKVHGEKSSPTAISNLGI
jgi:hypothetical protein